MSLYGALKFASLIVLSWTVSSGCVRCIHYGDPDFEWRDEGGWRSNPSIVWWPDHEVEWCPGTLFHLRVDDWIYDDPPMDSALFDSVRVIAYDSAENEGDEVQVSNGDGSPMKFGLRRCWGLICLEEPLPTAILVKVYVRVFCKTGEMKPEVTEYMMRVKDHRAVNPELF
jgi:hypothetical protein